MLAATRMDLQRVNLRYGVDKRPSGMQAGTPVPMNDPYTLAGGCNCGVDLWWGGEALWMPTG
jgi:hypothetical protein